MNPVLEPPSSFSILRSTKKASPPTRTDPAEPGRSSRTKVVTLAMASTSTSRGHTKAWAAFGQNLDSIAHMVALVSREQAFLQTESTRFKRYMKRVSIEVARAQTLAGKSPALALLPLQAAVAKLKLASERYKRSRQTRDERIGTVTL